MIKAELERDAHSVSLEISGHAGFAPHGEDILCAAVSALVCGLSAYAGRLDEEGFAMAECKREIGPGEARIYLHPEPQVRERVRGAFELAAEILTILGVHFPENIHFTEKRRTINDN